MRFSRKIDAFFIALIAVTLQLKIFTLRSDPPTSAEIVLLRLQEMLRKQGMAVQLRPDVPLGAIVLANRDRCRLWARDYLPYGTFLTDFREQAKPFGRLMFVYRGVLYLRPPKIDPLFRSYIAREIARASLRPSRSPIVAVAASRQCELNSMAWSSIAEVPW